MSDKTIYGIHILGKDAIKTDQDGIKTTLAALDLRIHQNAVQCLIHAEIHGDTSLMRRLLVDIIDTKNGYRRQGLINWMRKHSPMELSADNINLSGTDEKGDKRPFLVEQANKTPFWTDKDNAERVARPVFQQALTGKFDQAIREFESALANTQVVNGKPAAINPDKAYYDGVKLDKVEAFFLAMKNNVIAFKNDVKDETREVRNAQATLKKALGGMDPAMAKAVVNEVLQPQPEKAPVLETEAA